MIAFASRSRFGFTAEDPDEPTGVQYDRSRSGTSPNERPSDPPAPAQAPQRGTAYTPGTHNSPHAKERP